MDEKDAYIGAFLETPAEDRPAAGIRPLSTDNLLPLGEQYCVDVGEAQAQDIRDAVNDIVAGLEVIETISLGETPANPGERTWRSPQDNPYNAVAVSCTVPPTNDGSTRLSDLSIGVKDNIQVAGVPMGAGSSVLAGYVPSQDAPVIERLREAGGTIAAKTRMDEFASGGGGSNSATGPVTNPHDTRRVTGGSSSGSGAAVAADIVDAALGTDTGGSVRIPASFCGIVGFAPTYGLVPNTGVIESTYTQDVVGAMTTTVRDAARLLEELAGKDRRDSASMVAAGRDEYRVGGYVDAYEQPPDTENLRVGILEGCYEEVEDQVKEQTQTVRERLEDADATVEDVTVDGMYEYGKAAKTIASYVELADHWRAGASSPRRNGVVDHQLQAGFSRSRRAASGNLGPFLKAKLLAGARVTEETDGRYYTLARQAQETLTHEFRSVFDSVDVILTPTMPDVAPRIEDATDPGFDYAFNTRIATIARCPAISVPNGTVNDLPVGIQLIADAFHERTLLAATASIEPLLES